MKRIWVVITGQVRKIRQFLLSLENLVLARDGGLIEGIVFSTWESEVDGYSGLRAALKSSGVILMESRPLKSVMAANAGNIERQKFLLYWGLSCVPTGAYVFKTRPDQVITTNRKFHDLLSYLNALDFSTQGENKKILPAKIWAGRLAIDVPFWVDDRYFFSTREVCLRLTQIVSDVRVMAQSQNDIAEVNWYYAAFSGHCYWALAVMHLNWLAQNNQSLEKNKEYRGLIKTTGFFWLAMLVYDKLVQEFFYVGYNGFNLSDYEFLGVDPLRAFEIPDVFGRVLDYYPEHQDNRYCALFRNFTQNLFSEELNNPELWRQQADDFRRHLPSYSDCISGPLIS